jgi:hypothetical protein
MKRTAAILGPTPPFLRWTIVVPCPFRDPDGKNVTDAAFRELRSLRAIAVGEFEDRVVDGICLHPDVSTEHATAAIGFPVQEVYAAFGGKEKSSSACRSCPANVPISAEELSGNATATKAGCFGWLPFGDVSEDSSPGFMRLMECEDHLAIDDALSIVQRFESALESIDEASPFPITSPSWYGVWSCKTFSMEQLSFLDRVCKKIQSDSIAWRRLARAIQVSVEHDLEFHVELNPPGHSDGQWWTTEASCAKCGYASPAIPCEVCETKAVPLRSRKMKVLGMRPYLKLVSIVGEEETVWLVKKYRSSEK